MFKDEYKKMNESIRPGSGLLEKTERSMEEIMNRKNVRRVSARMAVALAMVGVLALTGVAFATGAIQNVFTRFVEWGYDTKTDINRLNELSENDLGSVGWDEWAYEDEVLVELCQAYYDGRQLITGAKYHAGKRVVILDANDERCAYVRPGDAAFCANPVNMEQGEATHLAEEYPTPESELVPAEIALGMSEEDLRAIEAAYAEQGEVYFLTYNAQRSDWIQVEGDDEEIICPSEDQWQYEEDGTIWRYTDYGTLPEKSQDQEELDITFLMHIGVSVCRIGPDGVWAKGKMLDDAEFCFTIPNGGQEVRLLNGFFENDAYTARAQLQMTQVGARLIVEMQWPDVWAEAYRESMSEEDSEADYVLGYAVMTPDGPPELAIDTSILTDENIYRTEAAVSLPEGQGEITLRPYYAKSGLREGEDIVLFLNTEAGSVK